MNKKYNILISKIIEFEKRYNLNKFLFGLFSLFIIAIPVFVILIYLENIIHFGQTFRFLVFYVYLILVVYFLIRYIFLPLFKLIFARKIINYKNTASIITDRKTIIRDKLFNIIELKELIDKDLYQSFDLVIASIEQKIDEIDIFSFKELIPIKKLLFRFIYIIGIVSLVIAVYSFKRDFVSENATHFINYNKVFINKKNQLNVVLLSDTIVESEENLNLKWKILNYDAHDVHINYGNNSYVVSKEKDSTYSYVFNSVNSNFKFNISCNNNKSRIFEINVIPKAIIQNFEILVKPPKYTKLKEKVYYNTGDIIITEGSEVIWTFDAINVDKFVLNFGDNDESDTIIANNGMYIYKKRIFKNTRYSLSLINSFIKKENIINYKISVIKDDFPKIFVNAINDTLRSYKKYFFGLISDDYGFTSLSFNYFFNSKSDSLHTEQIDIKAKNEQKFNYFFDFNNIDEKDNISYYFEVYDNDDINGFKYSRTKEMTFKKISLLKREEMIDSSLQNIETNLYKTLNLSNEISNDLEKIRQNSLSENMNEFDKKELTNNLLKKKSVLEDLIENINKENDKKNQLNNINNKRRKELIDKQKQIQELLKNLMTDEIQKLIDELAKLREKELSKNQLNKLTDKIKINLDELDKQMKKSIELLKNLEIQNKIDETIKELRKSSDKIEGIKNEIKKKDDSISQENLNKEKSKFEEIKKNYDKALDLNNKLEQKMNLEKFEKDINDIKNDFENSDNNIKNGKNKKSKQSLDKLSNDINQLADKIENMLNKNQQNSISIDIEMLRSVVDNLNKYSFDQENLLVLFKNISVNNPKFIELQNNQNNLNLDYRFIKNQLDSLSPESAMLSSVIKNDIVKISEELVDLKDSFDKNSLKRIVINQQLIMTSINNLSLLLDEILNSLNEQQNSNSKGGKSCSKPGKSKPGLGSLKKQQQDFKSQLQSMINKLKDGKNGKSFSNSELSKMLARQEMMRKMINSLENSNEIGGSSKNLLNDIKKNIDENIRDIVNNNIDNDFIRRQDIISTRLLKAEKAERERDIDKKRKAEENKVIIISNPIDKLEYKKENYVFDELFDKKSIKYSDFYKKKVNLYFKSISN